MSLVHDDPTMSKWQYDVLISFGAEDPCKVFADQLCNGLKESHIRARKYDDKCFSWFDDFSDIGDESMISIELIYSECASLSHFIREGVRLLKKYHKESLLLFYYFSPRVWKFGEALDITEAEYGDEVHEWKKAVLEDSCFYGCDIIDMTKEYKSSIDEIILQSHKMIQQEFFDRVKLSRRKYDMLLSYRGDCEAFVNQLHDRLEQKGILTYRNDIQLSGRRNNENFHEYLDKAYETSRFSIKIAYINDLHLTFYRNIPPPTDGSFIGAKAHQWPTEKYFTIIISREDLETTNGYQSSIDFFIKQIRIIYRKESSGRKGFELTSYLEKRLAIFWDMKSSQFSANLNPDDIAKKIEAFVKRETNNNWDAIDVYAYGHSSAEQKLYYRGITLIYTPRGRKDTTHIALLVDMFNRSHSCSEPSAIMLITGNISCVDALHALWLLGHKIILVTSTQVGASVSLKNASIYIWSDVAKGTSSSQVQIDDDNNNWPGSNLVKREDLVATSSSQCQELYMRCEEFVSIDPLDKYLYIFWDLENCPIPGEVPAEDVALHIRTFVTGKIDCSSLRIRAYGGFSHILGGEAVSKSLENSGVKVINTPHRGKKNAADEAMMIDLFMYSKLVRSPSSIMVITGDVDFATTLRATRFRHDIFLAVPSRPEIKVSEDLTSAAKVCWYWSDVVNGRRIN